MYGPHSGANVDHMDPRDVALAKVVRKAIREARLTQSAVYEPIGIPRSTWKRRIAGTSSFTFSELMRVAETIDARASELVERAEEQTETRMAS